MLSIKKYFSLYLKENGYSIIKRNHENIRYIYKQNEVE
jgi:hypothetical protein